MAESDKLYHSDNPTPSNKKTTTDKLNNSSGASKFAKQALNSVKTGVKNTVSSGIDDIVGFAKGLKNSAIDAITPKGLRNGSNKNLPIDFSVEDVSIANRHTNAINNILNGVSTGDIFGTGVQVLNLVNFGTTWTNAKAQNVDKDAYSFKYSYLNVDEDFNIKTSENNTDIIDFLDKIEDPTVLNFSLKIDYSNSPLFNGYENSGNIAVAENNANNTTISTNSAKYFISQYQSQIRELNYADSYMNEFVTCVQKVFSSPETEAKTGRQNTNLYKNHYIYEIDGLDKLDNKFVKYDENEEQHETLEFTIGEDIRMYIKRMIFLYKNLTYSYNMGKKLIPENLLRFNLYIKISDMRSYTSENSNIKDGYSRMIYELKDCEFLFDPATLPSSIKMSGFDVNNDSNFNEMKFKIKYRKVNRIFYSEMYGDLPFLIGDKYFVPNTDTLYNDLSSMKFTSEFTKKRQSTSNNIPVVESLAHNLNKLKTNGIFNEKENDNAVGRFVKGIGNQAVKTGANFASEGLQNIKTNINNNIGKDIANTFNNNVSSQVKNLLKTNVQIKASELGTNLFNKKQYSSTNEVISDDNNIDYTISLPENDDSVNDTTISLSNIKKETTSITNVKVTTLTSENLNTTNVKLTQIPSENTDTSNVVNTKIKKENLNTTTVNQLPISNENLNSTSVNISNIKNENLNTTSVNITNIKTENLNTGNLNSDKIKLENLNSGIINNITQPKENLNNTIVTTNNISYEVVFNTSDNKINKPDNNLDFINNDNIIKPNETLFDNTKKDISIPVSPNINVPETKTINYENINNSKVDIKSIDFENVSTPFKKYIITPPPPNAKIDGLDENK